MLISGLVKSSFIDYPGLVACVLFVPGCNYDCFYCHNRSLIDGSHEILLPGYVDDFLRKRAGMLDGVVITGGEPTLQSRLIPYLAVLKELGYKVKLDTNGSSPKVIAQVLASGLCDYFAVDYKAPAKRYKEICGLLADADKVLETVHMLLNAGAAFEVRTTVIPQLTLEDLLSIAKELPVAARYVYNRYRPPQRYLSCHREWINAAVYTKDQLEDMADQVRMIQPGLTL